MAEQLGVAFIGRIPIYQPIREGSDNGVPLVMSEPNSVAAKAFSPFRTARLRSVASRVNVCEGNGSTSWLSCKSLCRRGDHRRRVGGELWS
jgi:hypothetical protein